LYFIKFGIAYSLNSVLPKPVNFPGYCSDTNCNYLGRSKIPGRIMSLFTGSNDQEISIYFVPGVLQTGHFSGALPSMVWPQTGQMRMVASGRSPPPFTASNALA